MYLLVSIMILQACSHAYKSAVPRAKDVNLERFMGDWYVIAHIPVFLESGAHNAVESYAMNQDGSIATTYRFNNGAFDGELKVYNPVGYVSEKDNSEWRMQFIWPFKAEYIIAYLSKDYQHTIIARTARDYLWIMSRSPEISKQSYNELIQRSVDMGYSRSEILKVPQQTSIENKQSNNVRSLQ